MPCHVYMLASVMNTDQKPSPRRGRFVIALILTVLFSNIVQLQGVEKVVTHYCFEVPTDPDQINIQTRILINDDPVNSVYAFDATSGDTSQPGDRTTDADCMKDLTGIADTSVDPIVFDFKVKITDASHKCGVSVQSDAAGTVIVSFLFRIYALSSDVNNNADASFMAVCRTDDLTGAAVATEQFEIITRPNIIRQQQSVGAYLRLRFSDTLSPVTVARVGDKITLSIEFYPNLKMGPDNFGSHFMIGFLGIDPILEPTASELYVIVVPRYAIRTDILVSTKHGQDELVIEDGNPLKIVLPSDLMGCSDGGIAEIQDKGVEITTYDMEVGLLVCSKETGTADCYTALPTDVTGINYVTSSMYVAEEASEIMIVSQYDGNRVTIDIPESLGHTITLNGTTTAEGGDLVVTLDKRMVFHLAQSTQIAATSTVSGYHVSADNPVTVISGSRNYADDHLMEQIPPTTKFWTHYVLIPVAIGDNRATTYIIQAVETGDTLVTRYLSSSTFETHTVAFGVYLPIDVAAGEPCELTADKPIMVTLVVNAPTSPGYEPSMVVMPSVNQWAPKYTFYHPEYTLTVLSVFKAKAHEEYYRVDKTKVVPLQTSDVLGPNGYSFGANILGSGGGMRVIEIDDTHVFTTFMAIGYLSDMQTSSVAVLGWGYRLSDKGECVRIGRINDGVDNDCDGLIDEELLNNEDDDGDGVNDEDVSGDTNEYAGAVAIRPVNCKVSAESTFMTPSKTHSITGTDGCAIDSESNLFEMNGNLSSQTGDNIGTGILPKILQGGEIEVSQYIGEPMLYFMCDIEYYCTSAGDTRCTDICSPAMQTRKRREDDTKRIENVTAKIWVFPYDTGTQKPSIKDTRSETSLSACMGNTFVQLSLASMGVLAAVCFFTAVCFCCLFRKTHKKDKERERVMHNNGSQKWFKDL